MTREEARKAAEVMLAFANGEKIEQYYDYDGEWSEVKTRCCDFNWDKNAYRIKPKEKFDPKTLKPFDKVLTRRGSESYNAWFPDFISDPPNDIDDGILCMCNKDDVTMVIPYNEDTKHLICTNKEAPEYYRYWED